MPNRTTLDKVILAYCRNWSGISQPKKVRVYFNKRKLAQCNAIYATQVANMVNNIWKQNIHNW